MRTAGAQSLTGQLSGTVVDTSDAVLPGVTVTLINELSGDQRTTVSNDSGNFVFAAVQAGTYTVKAELSGFQTIETKGIVLRLGENRNLTAAEAGRGRPDRAGGRHRRHRTGAHFLGREERRRSRASRFRTSPSSAAAPRSCLKILPGMVPLGGSNGAPGLQRRGHRHQRQRRRRQAERAGQLLEPTARRATRSTSSSTARTRSDPGCNCATSVNPNPDMVEEFKVLQANFGAENAKGPTTVNVVSKAGGRDFRGTAYLYARNFRWNSNEWFLNKVDNAGRRSAEQAGEQVLLPRLQHRRSAADSRHGLQQGPRQAVLLLRVRVLQAGPRHGHAALVGADAGHAQRRLQRRGVSGGAGRWRRPALCQQRRLRPGQRDRSERPRPAEPAAAAEHQPGAGQRLQLRAERAAQPEQPPGPRPRGRQRQRQHEAVLPVQLPGGSAAVPRRSVVAQRQPGAVSRRRWSPTTGRTRRRRA